VGWQLEQAEEFRQEVEQYTDAERVVLADAYQDLLRFWAAAPPGFTTPDPSAPRPACWRRLCPGASTDRGRIPGPRRCDRGAGGRCHPDLSGQVLEAFTLSAGGCLVTWPADVLSIEWANGQRADR
jgi:hypothetical protein